MIFARNYRLLSILGQGGMGTVYLAEDLDRRHRVALKVLQPQFSTDAVFLQRFWREYQILRSLHHRNIVRVYEFGEWQGSYFIVSEYIQGVTLAQLLQNGYRFGIKQTVGVIQQVACALDAAHQRDIVHRDLKPGNVMQEKGGRIVLTDFGIARIVGRDERLTYSGEVMGTCAYMSPEQISAGSPLTYRADIYALGVLTYRMLAGRVPFDGDNPWGVFHAHLNAPPPPLQPAGVSPAVESIVMQALQKRPEQRPGSAGEFANLLAQAVGMPAYMAIPGSRESQGVERKRFNILWVGVIAAAILSLLAILLLLRSQGPAAPVPAVSWTVAYVCGERGDNLCIVDDTGVRRIFALASQTWSPAWSPDGQKLAFTSDANGSMAIWILDLETNTVRALTTPPGYEAWSPSWSPDGQTVVFDQKAGGAYNIFTQRLDSPFQRELTYGNTLNSDADWSPTGEHIVFVSDREGNQEIYVMTAEGHDVTRLTEHPGNDFAPVWSPDGQWIAYECEDDTTGDMEICIMDATGGQRQTLTQNTVADRQPDWSPDGQYIIFTRQRSGSSLWDIWIVRCDGSAERLLIQDRYSSTHPVWKP
ncbi:MAG TPA: protein kinase [Anaerolineaceae bacterium]|nr:protein kinase [Anaerolineaceae bacterium]